MQLVEYIAIENVKKYIEESDLKGYKFIEIKDINDGIPIVEEKRNIFLKKSQQESFIQMEILNMRELFGKVIE